ncbi:MAG: NAD-dependent dehydratase, partial [Syntrophales bacterium]|nr:NAD-dependent dehydratase [Syntrophales bacterium]
PGTPVGPWDARPPPPGQMMVDFLRGRMPAYLDPGLNLVHVKDVARGHLLAEEKGRVGEKYIWGTKT